MKQRFSSLDVKVISRELSSIVGLRIANIYDLSSRICLFKLQLPDVRKQLVVDPGFRCHLTEYTRTTADAPSPFVARLRKFIKTRRVTKVSQIGTDRILHFEISDGQFHLFFEFFAAGNIILTNSDFNVVALLRTVSAGSGQEPLRNGSQYSIQDKQNYWEVPPVTADRLRGALEKAGAQADATSESKKKKKKADELRRALSAEFSEFPPLLLDHAFCLYGFDSSHTPEQILNDQSLFERLMQVLNEADNVTKHLSSAEQTPGYIICKRKSGGDSAKDIFDDFHPFIPKQFESNDHFTISSYPTFSKAVDEYFSTVETQKLESKLEEREAVAQRKLSSARKDHEKRLNALQEVQETHIRKAQAIELNVSQVEEVMNSVNGLIAQGMDWVEIARLIEMEQGRQNPVAKAMKLPLKLSENTVTILLPDPAQVKELDESASESESESESDDEDKGEEEHARLVPKYLAIDIDLGQSPWANARQYYDQKKIAADKKEKTLKASRKALESHEKKVAADLKRGLKQEKPVLRLSRTPFWFEKFFFFISSDGYLVLGDKDTQQAELLYLYHLNKGDIYVHTDVEKAVPMIVKNNPNTPNAPIPPSTLQQAGTFSVASSKAWDTKALMGSWWVKADQVSKTTPEGEYLNTGGVFVSGEKNPLPPAQLVMGFATLFQISEDSVKNHRKLRDIEDDHDANSSLEDTHELGVDEQLDQQDHLESINLSVQTEKHSAAATPSQLGGQTELKDVAQQQIGSGTSVDGHAEGECDAGQGGSSTGDSASEESSAEAEDSNISSLDNQNAITSTKPPSANSSSAPTGGKANQHVRGKRGKNKKISEKYKWQDEEDKALALRLLGSASVGEQASSPARKSKSAHIKTKEQREAESEARLARRRAQHEKAAQAERERLQRLRNGVQDMIESVEKADMSMLPCLVGSPKVEDEVVGAIPICAPWTALATFRYKTKIQPGPLKRGKAVKEMIGRWVVDAEMAVKIANKSTKKNTEDNEAQQGTPSSAEDDLTIKTQTNSAANELELLKTWKDTEGVNCVPVSNMRIVSGAGDKTSKGKGKGASATKKEKPSKGPRNLKRK